jgi:PAS domain S-box-containing protein
MRAVALRYALAPACVLLAVLLHLSPAGPALNPTGLLAIGVLVTAWFGGAGPGFIAAVLAGLTLPRIFTVDYPLLGGFLDLPRFVTLAVAGLVAGWWSFRRRQVEVALRESEKRYELAMGASDEGVWDWTPAGDKLYLSPRFLEIFGFPPGTTFDGRAEMFRSVPMSVDDRAAVNRAIAEHFAGRSARLDFEFRILVGGAVRWIHARGFATRDSWGELVRWNGAVSDVTERKRAEEALRNSGQRYALAMEAAGDGHTDWDLVSGEFYISPQLLEIVGHPPDASFADRADWVRRFPFHPEDRPKWEAAVAAHLAGRDSHFKMELRIVVRGELRWTAFHFLSTRDAAGKPIRWSGSIGDITEQKRVEEALRASEERISLAMEASEEGYIDCDVQTDRFIVSERMREIFEVPPGTRISYRSDFNEQFRFYSDEDAKAYGDMVRTVSAQGGPDRYEFEFRAVLLSGKVKWIWTRSKVTRDAQGRALRRIGVVADVTARKLAEHALRESEDRFARAVAGSDAGVWDIDLAGRSVFFSARTRELCGLPPGPEVVPLDGWFESLPLHPEDLPKRMAAVEAHLSGKSPAYDGEFRFRQPDGIYRWRHLHGVCVRDAAGKPLRLAGSMTDVDARRRAEDALRESEERYRRVAAATEAGIWDWDILKDRYYVSPPLLEMAGLPPDTVIETRADFRRLVPMHPEDLAKWQQEIDALFAGTGSRAFTELRVMLPSGVRWVRIDGMAFRDATGKVVRWTGSSIDVTKRRLAEEALRQSEERYEVAMEASESGYWDWDLASGRYFISARANELVGLPREDTISGRNDFNVRIPVHPEDWAMWEAARKELFEGTGERLAMELRYIVRGEVRWHSLNAICKRDETGKVVRWTGSATDVTERRQAEESLRQSAEQLRLAQRLEAMGTLAGGIAHDFNNILGAVLGYGEMAQRDAPKGSRLARDLDAIMIAGERGRALVDRVLAFSRSAVGERVPVHVERVVREALDLVLAKLPPSVTVHAKLHTGSAAVLGDTTQVHQVVVNLATNAIHAMPAGGTLRVELSMLRVEAPRAATVGGLKVGDYVVLKVADTGGGIAPEIVNRIFDPFFTTKEVGTGTGLGLSLVHGIVTELGGCIDVVTKPGTGSTFVVHLPRSGEAPEAEQGAELELPRGGGQRVLVVDDEEPLVQLATRTLEELGYAPVGFTSSDAALAAFRADPQQFDALVTDERMPGLSGSALIHEVRGIRSSIPVVLMSGYLGTAAGKADEVLQKPLSARDLATSLARVLRL